VVIITPATPTDAPAVIALWHACALTRPWNDPQADFTLALETPTSTILLAREGDAVTGSVMVGFDGHRGWVYYLAVAPVMQRGGIGRALMQAAEGWLNRRGAPKIQLMVRDENAAMRGFYLAVGYDVQPVITIGKWLDKTS
jgi:ribosomal protein S18 acetylase RimI-like enzyme